ncbi:dTDP-4-dehydrorhamnose 3,5-epimerase [Corynebacterium sp. H128]|uniref:dTDP-4-dehydrorhamnose 3,5-epimerase n=1 Tax=unclassified Corynebacterium TaxID=2624378 RepID=UPI0030B10D80
MLRAIADIPGLFVSEPKVIVDERGAFNEWFKASEFEEALGFPFDLQQSNISTSKKGVLRGFHFADVPPGQAKFVSCLSGAILDVAVDVRVGSPTYLKWAAVELTAANRKSLYLPVGIAHGFLALEDSTVAYLTSAEYRPNTEHGFDPFDPTVGVEWPEADYILSEKDKTAPALADAPLPSFEACEEYENMLRDGWALANMEAGA